MTDTIRIYTFPHELRPDHRGWVFFPFQTDPGQPPAGCDLKSLHIVRTDPGHIRGDHVHPETGEWLCVFEGRGVLSWLEDDQVRETMLERADQVVYIPAGIPHVIYNPGPDHNFLLSFREKPTSGPHSVSHPVRNDADED